MYTDSSCTNPSGKLSFCCAVDMLFSFFSIGQIMYFYRPYGALPASPSCVQDSHLGWLIVSREADDYYPPKTQYIVQSYMYALVHLISSLLSLLTFQQLSRLKLRGWQFAKHSMPSSPLKFHLPPSPSLPLPLLGLPFSCRKFTPRQYPHPHATTTTTRKTPAFRITMGQSASKRPVTPVPPNPLLPLSVIIQGLPMSVEARMRYGGRGREGGERVGGGGGGGGERGREAK